MKIKITIAKLASLIEVYKDTCLRNNEELSVLDLNLSVPAPQGQVKVSHIIKKINLPVLEVKLENGYSFKAAKNHIVRKNEQDVFLKDIRAGSILDHRSGPIKVVSIAEAGAEDCFDLAVPNPHLYYDANGLVHHNTILTATLCDVCAKIGRTVTIVPNRSLVEQTEEDFRNCGLDVGVYFGGRKELGKTHTICTWQSLSVLNKKSKDDLTDGLTLAEFLEGVKTVIVDEAHQADATILKDLLTQNLHNACVRWGLTGTVPKEPYEYESIFASIGPVVGGVKAHELQEEGTLSTCHINIRQLIDIKEFKQYHDEYNYLVTNNERLDYIANEIKKIALTGNTLVLVTRVGTGETLQQKLTEILKGTPQEQEVSFVSGAVKGDVRKETYNDVKTSHNKIIIATAGVAAVGINIPRIFNLVMLEPGKSFVRVIQSIGRGIRKAADKDHVEIWDFASTCKFAKRHLAERKKHYSEAKYPFTLVKEDWDQKPSKKT